MIGDGRFRLSEIGRRSVLKACLFAPLLAPLLSQRAQAGSWVALSYGASSDGFKESSVVKGETFKVTVEGVKDRSGIGRSATGPHWIRTSGNPNTPVKINLGGLGTGTSKKMPWSYGPPGRGMTVEIWCPTNGSRGHPP